MEPSQGGPGQEGMSGQAPGSLFGKGRIEAQKAELIGQGQEPIQLLLGENLSTGSKSIRGSGMRKPREGEGTEVVGAHPADKDLVGWVNESLLITPDRFKDRGEETGVRCDLPARLRAVSDQAWGVSQDSRVSFDDRLNHRMYSFFSRIPWPADSSLQLSALTRERRLGWRLPSRGPEERSR